jgi:hypothetical protein
MPNYSIKDLFFSTSLIASGIMGLIAIERWMPVATGVQAIGLMLLYYAAFILVGTGVMLPFKRVTFGIIIGIVMAVLSTPFLFVDK